MWGNEAPYRAQLWDLGARATGQDGWLLICDADMILCGDPRPLTLTTKHNAWAWHLYDVWDQESTYRADGYWQGHLHPRPWLFKPSALGFDEPVWNDRGIHVGHCPHNAQLYAGIDPMGTLFWLHLAYLKREDRLQKRDRYLTQAHQLSEFELQHALSVGD